MIIPPNDRLLQITRIILTLLMVLTVVAVITMLGTLPILYFKLSEVSRDMAASGIDAGSIPWLVVMLLLGAIIATLGFFFFRHLRRIVDSVSEGDPFVPINADRLRAMAWISLAIQAMLIPGMGLVVWFDALPQKANVHYSDNNSFGGLILALLLFVLARVFRVGSEMREELEGTV